MYSLAVEDFGLTGGAAALVYLAARVLTLLERVRLALAEHVAGAQKSRDDHAAAMREIAAALRPGKI